MCKLVSGATSDGAHGAMRAIARVLMVLKNIIKRVIWPVSRPDQNLPPFEYKMSQNQQNCTKMSDPSGNSNFQIGSCPTHGDGLGSGPYAGSGCVEDDDVLLLSWTSQRKAGGDKEQWKKASGLGSELRDRRWEDTAHSMHPFVHSDTDSTHDSKPTGNVSDLSRCPAVFQKSRKTTSKSSV